MALPVELEAVKVGSGRIGRRSVLWGLGAMGVLALLASAPAAIVPWGAGVALTIAVGAFVAELVDSSLGMGYGTTLTPLLLIAGFAPLDIVPAVLMSELVTGLAAGLMHQRDGNVDWRGNPVARRSLLWLASLSGLGAVAAVVLAVHISKRGAGIVISLIIIGMAVVIFATLSRRLRYRPGALIGIGTVAAFNKGLSGGGYGPLVTAGQVVSGVDAKAAVAVTSVAEAITCLVGLGAYLFAHRAPLVPLALPLTLGALLSVPLATATVRRFSEQRMRAAVGVGTLALGVVALVRLLMR